MSTQFMLLAFTAVLLGGLVKGVSGFGYAVMATSTLAAFTRTSQAVAFLIIPLVAIQLELVSKLEKQEIKTCTANFKTYITALTAGTLIGFHTLTFLPETLLKIFLGVLTLLFAASKIKFFGPKFERLQQKCFRRSQPVQLSLGFLSGLVFGAANIGIQIVAYLQTMELDRRKFTGLLALVMIPVSGLRLPLALGTVTGELLIYSILAAPVGMTAAWIGDKAGEKITEYNVRRLVLLLLVFIGLNLIRTAAL